MEKIHKEHELTQTVIMWHQTLIMLCCPTICRPCVPSSSRLSTALFSV